MRPGTFTKFWKQLSSTVSPWELEMEKALKRASLQEGQARRGDSSPAPVISDNRVDSSLRLCVSELAGAAVTRLVTMGETGGAAVIYTQPVAVTKGEGPWKLLASTLKCCSTDAYTSVVPG